MLLEKVMAKHDLVRQKQVAHVKSEKAILEVRVLKIVLVRIS